MKHSRRVLVMLAAAGLIAGCARNDGDNRIRLGFSQIGAESEWRTANSESIKAAAATMNIDLRFADAQQKQENQIKALRTFIAQKVDVIAFSPVVETGWDTVLQEAKAAKIPVILTDRSVTADPSLYVGFIGSDFVEEGRKAGRWALEHFKDGTGDVNIVELQGTVGAGPAIDRKKGFCHKTWPSPAGARSIRPTSRRTTAKSPNWSAVISSAPTASRTVSASPSATSSPTTSPSGETIYCSRIRSCASAASARCSTPAPCPRTWKAPAASGATARSCGRSPSSPARAT